MTCHDRCRYAQMCRLSPKADHREDGCWEYLHWDDMALDAESAKGDYRSKYDEELPFDEPGEEDEEVMEFDEEYW